MKIRIRDNSFRFRITIEELERLREDGTIEVESIAGPPDEGQRAFSYRLFVDSSAGTVSHLLVEPYSISLVLSPSDVESLGQPDREGIYVRHEWTAADGSEQRSMIMVEKDRPASTCDKPDEWIYREEHGGVPPEVRPIPKRTVR